MLADLVIAAALLFLIAWYVRRGNRRRRAARWGLSTATIEAVQVINRGHNPAAYDADISYSYEAKGSQYSGTVSVPGSWWRLAPSSDLSGRQIRVRVNPSRPEASAVVAATLPGIDESVAPPLLVQGANR